MSCLVNCLLMALLVVISEIYFNIEKGIIKRGVLSILLFLELAASSYFHQEWLGWLFALMTLGFYLLCYAHNEICKQFIYLGGISILLTMSISIHSYYPNHPFLLLILMSGSTTCFLLLLRNRKISLLFITLLFSTFLCFQLATTYPIDAPIALLFILILAMMEWETSKNATNYKKQTNKFQNDVMMHHYEEIQSVYLNMRGWRHDYHNHIQAIRAYLSFNQIDEATQYLQELEADLDRVDTLVKSGHLMMDAILNSKLSMALSKEIQINVKATLPKKINVSDVDICVLLGNLLDNAIEACMKVDKEQRFIRIYIDTMKHQLYISITNSASENITLNERQYISEKRGNHGHGMKRVKLCVDKYHGYLNLKNEVGVFVSEAMIPLDH